MPGWLVPLLSMGGSAVQSYLSSRRSKRGYEPSRHEMMLIDAINKELGAGAPGSVTAPFVRRRKAITQKYARQPGLSGIESAQKSRFVDAPQSEAVRAWRLGLMREKSALARGTGTYWQDQPTDIGMPLEDLGYMLAEILHRRGGGGKKAGGGGSISRGYGGYRSGGDRNVPRPGLQY